MDGEDDGNGLDDLLENFVADAATLPPPDALAEPEAQLFVCRLAY